MKNKNDLSTLTSRPGTIFTIFVCLFVIVSVAMPTFAIFNYSSTTINGSGNNDDYGYGITVDGSGNIYVTGTVYEGTNNNIWVAKYNSNLVLQTSTTINGSGNGSDEGYGITIDTISTNAVWLTGVSYETAGGNNIWLSKHLIDVDTIPPGQVTGVVAVTDSQVQLQWVAPGDDGYSGNVEGGK